MNVTVSISITSAHGRALKPSRRKSAMSPHVNFNHIGSR